MKFFLRLTMGTKLLMLVWISQYQPIGVEIICPGWHFFNYSIIYGWTILDLPPSLDLHHLKIEPVCNLLSLNSPWMKQLGRSKRTSTNVIGLKPHPCWISMDFVFLCLPYKPDPTFKAHVKLSLTSQFRFRYSL